MNTPLGRDAVYGILLPVLDPVLHRKRILALSLATVGVAHAPRVTIHGVGQSLAAVTGKNPKHGIKQVDRLLSNDGVDVGVVSGQLARWIVGERREVVVALDWTEYAGNGHSTVRLSLVTDHGRATPLATTSAGTTSSASAATSRWSRRRENAAPPRNGRRGTDGRCGSPGRR